MIVYKRTCNITGKSYIGWTSLSLMKRWENHYWSALQPSNQNITSNAIYNAIRKYGKDCWKHEILSECKTENQAKKLEVKFIKKFNTYNNGYNSTLGGDGTCRKHTPEAIEKIKIAGRRPCSEETKRKIGLANKGKRPSVQTIEAAKKANLGSKHSKKHKEKISQSLMGRPGSNGMLGKKHTQKTKTLMSKRALRRQFSIETRNKMREAKKGYIPWNKGISFSNKAKENMRQAALARWAVA